MKVLDSPCLRHKCARCCRETSMPITIREAEIIALITKKNISDFTKDLNQTGGILQLANSEKTNACVFLNTNSKEIDAPGQCSIHAKRPQGCRIYPIILDMEDEVWMDDVCPHTNEFAKPDEISRQALLALDANIQAEARMRSSK
nr:YkgJ family cysteine cluster protein [Euryarchaeota archaeon]